MTQHDQLDQGKSRISFMRSALDKTSSTVDFTLPNNRMITIRKINPSDLNITDEEKDKIYENHKSGGPIFILKKRVAETPDLNVDSEKGGSKIILRRVVKNSSENETDENPEVKKLVVGNVICQHEDTRDEQANTIIKSYILVPPSESLFDNNVKTRSVQMEPEFENGNQNEVFKANENSDINEYLDEKSIETSDIESVSAPTSENEDNDIELNINSSDDENEDVKNNLNEYANDPKKQDDSIINDPIINDPIINDLIINEPILNEDAIQNNEIFEEEEEELDPNDIMSRNVERYVNMNDDQPPFINVEEDQNEANEDEAPKFPHINDVQAQYDNYANNTPNFPSMDDQTAQYGNDEGEVPQSACLDNQYVANEGDVPQLLNMDDQEAQFEKNFYETPEFVNQDQYGDLNPELFNAEEQQPAIIITDGEIPQIISREDEMAQEFDNGDEMVPMIEKQFDQNFNLEEEGDGDLN